jgi:hypothetical protein
MDMVTVTVPLPYSALERVILVNLFSRCHMSNRTLWTLSMPWNHMRTIIVLYIHNVSLHWTNANLHNSIKKKKKKKKTVVLKPRISWIPAS